MADAQLALFHLASRRFQRRAARSQPRQDGLGHEATSPRSSASAWAAGRCAPARNSAISSITMPCVYEFRQRRQVLQLLPAAGGTADRGEGLRHGHARARPTCMEHHSITGRRRTWRYRAARQPTTCTRPSTTSCSPRIRAGKPINNGDYMCKSTLMAIMGRMASYTGQEITWARPWPRRKIWGRPATIGNRRRCPAGGPPGITRFVWSLSEKGSGTVVRNTLRAIRQRCLTPFRTDSKPKRDREPFLRKAPDPFFTEGLPCPNLTARRGS